LAIEKKWIYSCSPKGHNLENSAMATEAPP
jgi:hypothetical protein